MQRFQLSSFKPKQVVVYADRAEVKRLVSLENLPLGISTVVLTGLSPAADHDSIRIEGTGDATILDVSYTNNSNDPTASNATDSKALAQTLKELEEQREVLFENKSRLEREKGILTGYANKITAKAPKDVSGVAPDLLKGLVSFMGAFREGLAHVDEQLIALGVQITTVEEKINVTRSTIQNLSGNSANNASKETLITITIESPTADLATTLTITYVITGASWKPRYDLRVFSNEKKLTIFYFGEIQQSTGENWTDVSLFLSTAQPAIGGQAPQVTPWSVHFYEPPPPPPPSSRLFDLQDQGENLQGLALKSVQFKKKSAGPSLFASKPGGGSQRNRRAEMEKEEEEEEEDEDAPQMTQQQATASVGMSSMLFEIKGASSIPSDSSDHRVTLAIVSLKPKFEYFSVPKSSARAYLTAKIKNDSEIFFLPGPTQVFVDNNFISRSKMQGVSPQEEFEVSLGVDESVRVSYPAAKRVSEQSGLLTRTTTVNIHQQIEIKNTKQTSIKVIVRDAFPRSLSDQIKVNVIEPEPKQHSNIKFIDDQFIQWTVSLQPEASHTINLRVAVSHPSNITTSI